MDANKTETITTLKAARDYIKQHGYIKGKLWINEKEVKLQKKEILKELKSKDVDALYKKDLKIELESLTGVCMLGAIAKVTGSKPNKALSEIEKFTPAAEKAALALAKAIDPDYIRTEEQNLIDNMKDGVFTKKEFVKEKHYMIHNIANDAIPTFNDDGTIKKKDIIKKFNEAIALVKKEE